MRKLRRFYHLSVLAFVLMTCRFYGQASTLTPAQSVAISAAETRTNEALGPFKYASVTYEVRSIRPAKQRSLGGPKPPPGTIAVTVVEHVAGSKNISSNGYQPAIYWLVPQSNGGWVTGYANGHMLGDVMIGFLYPTADAAAASLVQPSQGDIAASWLDRLLTGHDGPRFREPANGYGFLQFIMGLISVVGSAILCFLFYKAFQVHNHIAVRCPSCGLGNDLSSGPCVNCHSMKTLFRRDPEYPLRVFCGACRTHTPAFPECSNCRTSLAGLAQRKLPALDPKKRSDHYSKGIQ